MRPLLLTDDQISAERLTIRLLGDPDVRDAMRVARAEWLDDPMASTADGLARLDRAVELWAASLIMMEAAGDLSYPKLLWVGETTPRKWGGHTFSGAALANDNPDTIYRQAYLDGAAEYELRGTLGPSSDAFVVEVLPETAGVIPASGTRTAPPGSVPWPGLLTVSDLEPDGMGRFRIKFGGSADGCGGVHVPLPEGSVALNLRDVLHQWTLKPVQASLSRVSPPASPPISSELLRGRVLQHLPAYIRHYAGFKDRYRGGIAFNDYVGPLARPGGWSFILSGRFSLEPTQTLVIRAHPNGARYQSIQTTDQWAVGCDYANTMASCNLSQALQNEDGSVTYVLAPEDPGVANWISTNGGLRGFVVMRWMLSPPDFDPAAVVRQFEIRELGDVAGLGLPQVSPSQRAEQIEIRGLEYRERLAC